MQRRKLGGSPLEVSALGFGLMSLSGIYGPANDDESVALIHYAIERGIDFLDSADAYGQGGHNEKVLGEALRGGRRDKVLVATKFGNVRTPEGKPSADGRPEYVMQACEASLKRLGIEVIDLYYQHRVDPKVPIEDTVGAMKRLVEQGKVRALGLSEASPQTIRRAHKVHPIAAVQSEYSLLYRVDAEETLKTTRELGISFVAYAPLGRSLLTGSIHGKADLPEGDRRLQHPRFQGENLDRNVALANRIEEFARAKGCTAAQLALAWLLAQGPDVVPIFGTKRPARLDENLRALEVRLTPAECAEIAKAVPPGAAAGTRYPEGQMKTVYL